MVSLRLRAPARCVPRCRESANTMAGPQPQAVTLSVPQQALLEALLRQSTCPQALALRTRIVLGAAAGQRNEALAQALGCSLPTVRKWRRRWAGAEAQLAAVEDNPHDLRALLATVLADAPRSGAPGSFIAEQIVQIVNLACTPPHRSRYWLNAKTKQADPVAFAEQVETVCTVYAYAPLLHTLGGHIVSCDEMTGIQALERIAPTKPMRPGQVERREFEYARHGTLSLIANFDVVTGQVVMPSLGPTRTEADFAAHIAHTIDTDPEAVWRFITDQLNTHQSEALVRLVAERCGLDVDLGVKGKSGVLQSMASRTAFLNEKTHRIQFVYVPKHTSWLNQIEIWFSILVRRVIKRGNFRSVDALQERILAFVAYFNQTAKPFRWTYTGRPLTV